MTYLLKFFLLLEEQIAVIHYASLLIELLHEHASSLSGLHLELLLGLSGIELSTLAVALLEHLEEVSTTVTLNN